MIERKKQKKREDITKRKGLEMKFPKKINIYTSTDVKEIKLNWLYNSLGTVFNFQCHFV